MDFASTKEAFEPLSAAFSPDHIVYAGHEFLHAADPGTLDATWKDYRARNGIDPRVVVVSGVGSFAIALSGGAAGTAMALLVDACAIAVYALSFGGALHMTRERIDFIRSWEVERYRAKASLGTASKVER
jgi:rhamnose utilization protein RhaD (predicted bifunctional aldolase and dehydrogenase)